MAIFNFIAGNMAPYFRLSKPVVKFIFAQPVSGQAVKAGGKIHVHAADDMALSGRLSNRW